MHQCKRVSRNIFQFLRTYSKLAVHGGAVIRHCSICALGTGCLLDDVLYMVIHTHSDLDTHRETKRLTKD